MEYIFFNVVIPLIVATSSSILILFFRDRFKSKISFEWERIGIREYEDVHITSNTYGQKSQCYEEILKIKNTGFYPAKNLTIDNRRAVRLRKRNSLCWATSIDNPPSRKNDGYILWPGQSVELKLYYDWNYEFIANSETKLYWIDNTGQNERKLVDGNRRFGLIPFNDERIKGNIIDEKTFGF